MSSVNTHGKSVEVKTKGPSGTKGNVVTHGKTAPIKTRSTGIKHK